MNLIIGRAGTGKTEEILNRIREDIKNQEKVYLIVPEQFSYTFEKKLTDSFLSLLNIQILSFTRLIEEILNNSKYKNKIYLDDISRSIILETILEKLDLSILKNKEKNLQAISNIIEEFKKYDVKIDDLKIFIDIKKEKNKNNLSLIKLEEIYNIYLEYNKQIENKYLDIADKETEVLKIIDETPIFEGCKIYIDQFAKFTHGEYKIIEKMLKQATSVNIAITTDSIHKKSDYEVFATTKNTISNLIQISQANNKEIKIIEKKVNIKHKEEMRNLEIAIFEESQILSRKIHNNSEKMNDKQKEEKDIETIDDNFEKNKENITIKVYKNIEDELDDIAQDIMNKIINYKYKFQEIGIVFNDLDLNEDLIRRIFDKYNIPVYLEIDKRLEKNSIARYILELLEIISSNYNIESVFAFLKLGYFDSDINDIYLLEKYVLRWNIKGSKWKSNWKNYDKLADKDFNKLISLKENFVKFVEEFKKRIGRYKNSKDISTVIYELIEEEKIFEKSINDIEKINISDERKLELKNEYIVSLNLIKEALDRIVSIKGEENISYEKYYNIFKLVLKETHIKQIPNVDDAVHFITTKTINMDGIKSLYIISLDDSLYPMLSKYKGLITDEEKLVLKQNNIKLSETDIEKLADDDFNMYSIFMIPSKSLHLSYHISSLEGESKRPSIYINKIKRRLRYLEEENRIKGLYNEEVSAYSNKALLDKVLSKYLEILDGKEVEVEWKYLIYLLQNTSDEFKLIEKNIKNKNIAPNLSINILEKLYKDDLYTSVSRLEEYAKCPFSYFAQYILNLKEDEKYELNPLNTGILLHDVIEEVVNMVKDEKISLNDINLKLGLLNDEKIFELRDSNIEYNRTYKNIINDIDNITEDIINKKLQEDKYKMFVFSTKFEVLTNKFKVQIKEATKAIINSLRLSNFEVLGNEIIIGDNFNSSSFDLGNNRKVKISGKIDRADILKKDNKIYLRIVDYKSSVFDLDDNLINAGLHLQLLTYLNILAKEKEYLPAGALYFGLSKYVKSISIKNNKEIEKLSYNNHKMSGLVLADYDIVKAMDKSLETGNSNIIPVGIKTNGEFYANSKIKTDDEFKDLRNIIEKNIKDMSNNILQGNISINPYKYKDRTGCKYCPYKKICQFDVKKNKYRNIKSKSKKE